MLVVHKASWPGEEVILRGTLADIRDQCRAAGIRSQAMIIVSPTLGARHWPTLQKSKLYDAGFGHRFRRGSATPGQAPAGFTPHNSTPRQGVAPGTEDQA